MGTRSGINDAAREGLAHDFFQRKNIGNSRELECIAGGIGPRGGNDRDLFVYLPHREGHIGIYDIRARGDDEGGLVNADPFVGVGIAEITDNDGQVTVVHLQGFGHGGHEEKIGVSVFL